MGCYFVLDIKRKVADYQYWNAKEKAAQNVVQSCEVKRDHRSSCAFSVPQAQIKRNCAQASFPYKCVSRCGLRCLS
jgi:hypothetical protein